MDETHWKCEFCDDEYELTEEDLQQHHNSFHNADSRTLFDDGEDVILCAAVDNVESMIFNGNASDADDALLCTAVDNVLKWA